MELGVGVGVGVGESGAEGLLEACWCGVEVAMATEFLAFEVPPLALGRRGVVLLLWARGAVGRGQGGAGEWKTLLMGFLS